MNLAPIDIFIIAVYFILILFLGFKAKSKSSGSDDESFLLASRRLTLPFFVASIVATWYGNILGVGEFIYSSGLVGWICFGVPYYISAVSFAFFFADKIRNLGFRTLPEQIANKFGDKAGNIASIIILIMTLPAVYVLMLGVIFQMFTGVSLVLSIVCVSIISLIYLFWGGFKADIWTNTAQFIIMYLGFFILLFFSIKQFGSIPITLSKLPKEHLTITGNKSWQYVLGWFIISLQTFVDPSFHQRSAAVKSPKIARQGLLWAVFCWVIFDMLTLFTGFYARANILGIEPLKAYPELGNAVLPPLYKGIFVIAILSVIMSTLDSYAFISSATIGNDILAKIFKKKYSIKFYTQIGLVITSIFSIVLALLIPSAIDLIYKTASIAIPGLIFPTILTYTKKYTIEANKIIWVFIIPSLVAFLWIIIPSIFKIDHFFSNIEPMMPSIIVAFIIGAMCIKKTC
ncbi:MAG TPA: sodium:solute symporter family protein [Candidatus Kapabacteria bacterium]|nr:sodium:solute symporter family protein [Candidatus Kapabacteria bacterium]